jgi:hypothetical protein
MKLHSIGGIVQQKLKKMDMKILRSKAEDINTCNENSLITFFSCKI